MQKILILFFVILGLVLIKIGWFWATWVAIDPKRPDTVIAAIEHRGATSIIIDSFEKEEEWNLMMKHIASGEDAWLEVFKKLAPGSDTHSGETLADALSKAMLVRPNRVLAVLSENAFSNWIPNVCGIIDHHQESGYATESDFVKEQRRQVSSVDDPKVAEAKSKCLQRIDEVLSSTSK